MRYIYLYLYMSNLGFGRRSVHGSPCISRFIFKKTKTFQEHDPTIKLNCTSFLSYNVLTLVINKEVAKRGEKGPYSNFS